MSFVLNHTNGITNYVTHTCVCCCRLVWLIWNVPSHKFCVLRWCFGLTRSFFLSCPSFHKTALTDFLITSLSIFPKLPINQSNYSLDIAIVSSFKNCQLYLCNYCMVVINMVPPSVTEDNTEWQYISFESCIFRAELTLFLPSLASCLLLVIQQ